MSDQHGGNLQGPGAGGREYGNDPLIPLFGGSGGGGGNSVSQFGGGGGGGGGAILIASSGKITLTGSILAVGGRAAGIASLPSGTTTATVQLAATGIPTGTTIAVTVTPNKGAPSTVMSTPLSGMDASPTTATADVYPRHRRQHHQRAGHHHGRAGRLPADSDRLSRRREDREDPRGGGVRRSFVAHLHHGLREGSAGGRGLPA